MHRVCQIFFHGHHCYHNLSCFLLIELLVEKEQVNYEFIQQMQDIAVKSAFNEPIKLQPEAENVGVWHMTSKMLIVFGSLSRFLPILIKSVVLSLILHKNQYKKISVKLKNRKILKNKW